MYSVAEPRWGRELESQAVYHTECSLVRHKDLAHVVRCRGIDDRPRD